MLPIDTVRAAFPALSLADEGLPRVYLDAPAGTQVAGRVVQAMSHAMMDACANDGGLFRTSRAAGAIADQAIASAATFFNCADDEVIFGLNTTSLFFQMAPLIAHNWQAGDNILLMSRPGCRRRRRAGLRCASWNGIVRPLRSSWRRCPI